MTLSYKSSTLPFSFAINGNISQIDYSWKIRPIIDALKEFDHEIESFNDLFYMLYRVKEWCETRGHTFIMKAAFMFRAAFYLFCEIVH